MPFANPAQLDPTENDAIACADAMMPELKPSSTNARAGRPSFAR